MASYPKVVGSNPAPATNPNILSVHECSWTLFCALYVLNCAREYPLGQQHVASMPLTDTRIKTVKPTEKVYKIYDAEGLHIEVSPSAKKSKDVQNSLDFFVFVFDA